MKKEETTNKEKKTETKSNKSSYSKKKKGKKIFSTVLLMFNLLLITPLYPLLILMEMLFPGHLQDKKDLKDPVSRHPTLLKLLLMQLQQKH